MNIGFAVTCLVVPVAILFFIALLNIRQVSQFQSGVLFTMGKFSRMLGPGWHVIIPIFQSMKIVDLRIKAHEVEGQETMTKDNVSVHVNAVIYYKIVDASKSVIEVEQADWAVSQLAQTTMRNVIGEATLDEVLAHRDKLSRRIEEIVDHTSEKWGVAIETVELKDIVLPKNLKRTMAKVAEAERERDANILKAEGEVIAAKSLAEAASIIAEKPGALHLRTLNSINDISSDQSNTVVFAVPMEILRAIEGFGKYMRGKKQDTSE
ncbi:MAG: slipin family protein [Candidatus Dojkabacteria bacterium]|nr:slipin family protein [Candidatus Dojkabacteria bacterium]